MPNNVSPTLAETQTLLRCLITAPEGPQAWLAAHPDVVPPVKETLALSAAARLDIYANMYFHRLLDSLKEDFPAIAQCLGDAVFAQLITDYLHVYPPSHFSLRYAGQSLEAFLRAYPSAQWPFLADLAQLEWAMLEAFDAPDAVSLDEAALRAIAPECWPALVLRPTPSLQVVTVQWPVDSLRETLLAAGRLADVPPGESLRVLVWRRGLDVVYRRASEAEVRQLQQLAAATHFAAWCETLLESVSSGGDTPMQAGGLIVRWVNEQLLIRSDGGRS